jgi:hypothetical protein
MKASNCSFGGVQAGAYVLLRWLIVAFSLAGFAGTASAAKTYADNGDGTVTDPTTGLIWMRCSMGQTWTGSTCTGTAGRYTWDQAIALTGTVTFAGQNDWRLPNIRELQTIVDRSVYYPAIDAVAFPKTPASFFFSASAYAGNSSSAWSVDFDVGSASSYGRQGPYQVRLVRAGQSFGLLNIARPSTDYIDHGNGTVTHTPTGLTWKRCAEGQSWTGSTCSGTASAYTWDAARLLTSTFAEQTDWRLPTEEELLSLVDYTLLSPAISVNLFPNTPSTYFWSTSAYASYSSYAWLVAFSVGYAGSAGKDVVSQVRLVRAVGPYDGIYVWSDGNYLSLHQDGSQMIATIYFNDNTSVDFKAASGGVLKVPQLDIFDLLSGAMTGSTAKVTGTRFHRACNVSYDFAFSENSKLTVTRTNVSNTAAATAAGISCSSIIANESPTMAMSKVPFGAAASTPAFPIGQYDGIYVWSNGNYLSLHQDGADIIATNYFNDNTSVDFRAASGGVLNVPQLDVFDLLSGSVTGSTAKIKGTRFHRACNVTYDFTFSGNINLTATRTGISNTPLADAAGISCSALLGSESGTITMQKVLFGR